jgi:hypothetical protein
MLMKVLCANFKADETTIITSNEFDALDPVSQLDILKDVIYDLRIIYSDKLKELRINRPSKQKIINANARERAMTAFRFRKKGWTYKAVGIAMGVSASRARSLVLKAERNLTKWQNI